MVEFCLVTHRIGAFIEDSDTDLDRKPDYMRINGRVRFTPKLDRGDAVLVTDDEGTRTVPLVPIDAQIIDGVLMHEGEPGVYVFAGGPNSNPNVIAYTVEYSGLVAGDHGITLRSTSFEAVPGGEVDLAGVTPVAGSTGRGIAKGDKGESPHIGENGNWWVADVDTGIAATGPQGEPGPVSFGDLTPEQIETLGGSISAGSTWTEWEEIEFEDPTFTDFNRGNYDPVGNFPAQLFFRHDGERGEVRLVFTGYFGIPQGKEITLYLVANENSPFNYFVESTGIVNGPFPESPQMRVLFRGEGPDHSPGNADAKFVFSLLPNDDQYDSWGHFDELTGIHLPCHLQDFLVHEEHLTFPPMQPM